MDDVQRLIALDHANQARMHVAELCAQIRAAGPRGGAQRAARVVMAGESSIRFAKLLVAVPKVGERGARRMLRLAQIDGSVRVCEVGPDRRHMLAAELLKHGERAGA